MNASNPLPTDAVTPTPTATEWTVLTGPPASGKTTLMELLDDLGTPTSADSTRRLIAEVVASGRAADEFRFADDFQPRALDAMLAAESALDPAIQTVLEYALPCNIAFHRTEERPVPERLMAAANNYRYANIVILDPLEWEYDPERVEGARYQREVYGHLWHVYLQLGYNPIRLPALPVEERLEFVRDVLGV